MKSVVAPAGYEGIRCYTDAARSWTVSLRKLGQTWWTNVGAVAGDDLDAKAAAVIAARFAWAATHGRAVVS